MVRKDWAQICGIVTTTKAGPKFGKFEQRHNDGPNRSKMAGPKNPAFLYTNYDGLSWLWARSLWIFAGDNQC